MDNRGGPILKVISGNMDQNLSGSSENVTKVILKDVILVDAIQDTIPNQMQSGKSKMMSSVQASVSRKRVFQQWNYVY